MGITANCSKFLFYSKSQGVKFDNTLTLGRLNLFATKKEIAGQISVFNNNEKGLDEVDFPDEYSEPLFAILGAARTDSIDFSDYERPTYIHDMNTPVPADMKNRYTAIVDGGTIEHIFNFPVAIKNCMEMLVVGGHYIGITPVNNLMGHGFYQFSPELYYNIFSEQNGFGMVKAVMCASDGKDVFSDWYEVINPSKVRTRVMFTNSRPTYLMVLAKKISDVKIFSQVPQQSDYETLWAAKKSLEENKALPGESKIRFMARKNLPRPIKNIVKSINSIFKKKSVKDENFGLINPEYFKKMNIN
jgi:hypothetical protein